MRFLMKLTRSIGATLLVAGASLASAGTIVGSAHDFSGQGWSGGQICVPCHTPHKANITVADAPLWNHALTAATFTLYSSPTLNATLTQPGGGSKLCFSCHDGTVAINSFGGTTDSTPDHAIVGTRSGASTKRICRAGGRQADETKRSCATLWCRAA